MGVRETHSRHVLKISAVPEVRASAQATGYTRNMQPQLRGNPSGLQLQAWTFIGRHCGRRLYSLAPIMISPVIHLVTVTEQNSQENNSRSSLSLGSHSTQNLTGSPVLEHGLSNCPRGSQLAAGEMAAASFITGPCYCVISPPPNSCFSQTLVYSVTLRS